VGVPSDARKAAELYRRSLDDGNIAVSVNLGLMYLQGNGVEKDAKEAVRLFRRGAEAGLAKAETNLGRMYYDGNGVEQDYAKAILWLTRAADQGAAIAQSNLAVIYLEGHGVKRDPVEAYKWFLLARDDDSAAAQAITVLNRELTLAQQSEAEHRAQAWMKAHDGDDDVADQVLSAVQESQQKSPPRKPITRNSTPGVNSFPAPQEH
jgi:hypothetical protein